MALRPHAGAPKRRSYEEEQEESLADDNEFLNIRKERKVDEVDEHDTYGVSNNKLKFRADAFTAKSRSSGLDLL